MVLTSRSLEVLYAVIKLMTLSDKNIYYDDKYINMFDETRSREVLKSTKYTLHVSETPAIHGLTYHPLDSAFYALMPPLGPRPGESVRQRARHIASGMVTFGPMANATVYAAAYHPPTPLL